MAYISNTGKSKNVSKTVGKKLIKYLISGIIPVIIPVLIVTVIFIPFLGMITNLPSILFNGQSDEPEVQANYDFNLKATLLYQNAQIYQENAVRQWIDSTKKENLADSYIESIDIKLEWQQLVAIDSVRYDQDFTKTDEGTINELASSFIEKSFSKSTYTQSTGENKSVNKTCVIITVKTKSFEEIISDIGFNDDQKEQARGMYENSKNIDIEEGANIYDQGADPDNLQEYPIENGKIPYYNQTDKRWGTKPYGESATIMESGCGPTSLAMVVSGLTNNPDITPDVVAQWSADTGHRCEGNGSYWSLMTDGGTYYGLNVTPVKRDDKESIIDALKQGNPVIASMGPGHFTKGGHFIVLRGITDDGKILVNDPISVTRSKEAWDIDVIMDESSSAGGEDGSPFWIFKAKK